MYLKILAAVTASAILGACGGGGNDDRPSGNADLSSLILDAAMLDPAFSSSITSYTAAVMIIRK